MRTRKFARLPVHTPTGFRDALQSADDLLATGSILELDRYLTGRALGFDIKPVDVSLGGEDAGHGFLHLRRWHRNGQMSGLNSVADSSQHIGNGIGRSLKWST